MKNRLDKIDKEFEGDLLQGIGFQKEAAVHHKTSAGHHHEAVKYHEAGDHGMVYESTIKARGHHVILHENH